MLAREGESQLALVIRGGGLRDSAKRNAGCGREVRAKLATFALVGPRIILPEVRISFPVALRRKLQDGNSSLLAVSRLKAEVPHSGFLGTIRTRIDSTAGS